MATELLRAWLERQVSGIPVQVVDGPDGPAGTVCLALADIGRADIQLQARLPDRDEARVQRVRMTYRVSAALDDPAEGHRTLCAIIFAALDEPVLQADDGSRVPLEVVPLAAARARFDPPARATLFLELTVERRRETRPAPPVGEPAIIHAKPVPGAGDRGG